MHLQATSKPAPLEKHKSAAPGRGERVGMFKQAGAAGARASARPHLHQGSKTAAPPFCSDACSVRLGLQLIFWVLLCE